MQRFLLFLFLFLLSVSGSSQELSTPWYWLLQANQRFKNNDSTNAFLALKKSVQYGLFDPQAVANKYFQSQLNQDQQKKILEGIKANRKKIESPSSIKIINSDIDRFWKIFEHRNDAYFDSLLTSDYIMKGSVGVQTFYQIRMQNSVKRLADKIRSAPKFYESIRPATLSFKKMQPQFIKAAEKLEQIYPESVFPPIYFLIGHLNNVGTADGYAGLLIGSEHLCKTGQTDTSELTAIDKMVLFDSGLVVPLIIHEYVHFQQHNKYEQTLLELSIMEGVADYITFIITGKYTNPEVMQFGLKNEPKLRSHFSKEMDGENTDNWLFNAFNPETGYPGNLGYFIGFRICELYYRKAANKKTAVREMLNIQDFKKILEVSGYELK
ncbi:DUF2268 domain-containing putative Zn-dependent protease [Pollutibacter soli]|uniref:gliding motility protein GldB-related protein n=1 Tax=Pollutibacter soli TaxID=3034157 RepID=UPI003013FBA6